ncbi:hypothetical protein [Pseudoramibacter sp.]|jgi:BMFP domain-containing protein YqiC|uniref:hypothetical protein n=1 Tax=Pseudoramibacter sp. TaxID=2034862 RepID=UPI0025EE0CF0|nr:hypothetical protein [Pseudoramibacter sp.]MCH4071966.1 hypothetical protein [Pseudoramibacter sp.]MCH4105734.1 hypothetical protein [Pseudoramibacter sp.]
MDKVTQLINELEELINRSSAVPFSSKTMIDPNEAMDIIKELRETLPGELKESKQIVANKKQILFDAQKQADQTREDASKQMKAMIDQNEVTHQAQVQAEAIIKAAQAQAKEIRTGTQHYADKILAKLQDQLRQLNGTIGENRKEIRDLQ